MMSSAKGKADGMRQQQHSFGFAANKETAGVDRSAYSKMAESQSTNSQTPNNEFLNLYQGP